MGAKRRYLVSAYYSDWVEANSPNEAETIFTDRLPDVKVRDYIVEVQEDDDTEEESA